MADTAPTPDKSPPNADTDSQFANLLSTSNWEALVEDARAKREQVLAERSRQTAAPSSQEPPTQISEPGDAAPLQVQAPSPITAAPPTPAPARPKGAVLRAIRHLPTETATQPAPRPQSALPPQRKGFSGRTVALAIGCCVGLGFGLSLGLAMMAPVSAPSVAQADLTHSAPETPAVITKAVLPDEGAPVADTVPLPKVSPPARPTFDTATRTPPKIHIYAPQSVTTAALDQNRADLTRMGFETAEVQRLNLTVSSPHVRFYDAADATLAQTLAQDLQITARDFTHSGNGSPGRVEIWLDGTAPQRSTRNAQTNPVDELIRLGNRFIRSLQ